MVNVHSVSKNVPPLACYNFVAHKLILIFFAKIVTDKVDNQKTLYCAMLGLKRAAHGWLKIRDAKESPSLHHRTTLSGYIFATKVHIDNRKKTC